MVKTKTGVNQELEEKLAAKKLTLKINKILEKTPQ